MARRRHEPFYGAQIKQVKGPRGPCTSRGCSRQPGADNLGSCQHVPPTPPASPCHVPPSCQTLPASATHPFISGWREEGLAKFSPQTGQRSGGRGGWGCDSPGVCLWYLRGDRMGARANPGLPLDVCTGGMQPIPGVLDPHLLPTPAFSNTTEVPPPGSSCRYLHGCWHGDQASPRVPTPRVRLPSPSAQGGKQQRGGDGGGGTTGTTAWPEQSPGARCPPGEQQSLVFPMQGQGAPIYSSTFLPCELPAHEKARIVGDLAAERRLCFTNRAEP